MKMGITFNLILLSDFKKIVHILINKIEIYINKKEFVEIFKRNDC
jgi:hypothetical protein